MQLITKSGQDSGFGYKGSKFFVIPAKAGISIKAAARIIIDSRLRGNDSTKLAASLL